MTAGLLKLSCPATRTCSARPSFANSHAYSPPCVGKRRLMQECAARSWGVSGIARAAKYDGAPTTAMHKSGPTRVATMSLSSTCSPSLTPASKRSVTISVSP